MLIIKISITSHMFVHFKKVSTKYITYGLWLSRQDARSVGMESSKIITAHKEILVDFVDAEANAFTETFERGMYIMFYDFLMRVV